MGAHFPLAMATEGRPVVVRSTTAGKALERRLIEMGIVTGTVVTVLQQDADGPLLLAVGDTRIGIGRGMAMKIMVAPAGDDAP